MKRHFQKLRKLTLICSTIAPFFILLAFLFVAGDHLFWAAIPAVIGFLLLAIFPTELTAPEGASKKSAWNLGFFLRLFGMWLLILWVGAQPGAIDLLSHLLSSDALWDWRIILAVALWCLSWSATNFHTAKNLEDERILAIYDDSIRDQIFREAEQGVAPQSATRSDSDSQSGTKPQPESKPRPR